MSTLLPPRHILSKSSFVRGCQCPKSLWLYKHCYGLRDQEDEVRAGIFIAGTNVGILAQQLFPGGVDATPIDAFHYQQSVADTARYIAEGKTIIYEAAFQYDGVLCAVDILVKHRDKWYAYEVKSSTKVKDPFLLDASLQHYVITNSGLPLADFYIVHLNNQYVRFGELDVQELFTRQSVKKHVVEQQFFIKQKVEHLKAIAVHDQMPEVSTGAHCTNPYTCDFYGTCWKDYEPPAVTYGQEQVLTDEIQEFIHGLQYPLHYMDFETYMLAVPGYDGHWPYRQVPFQFSVHIHTDEEAPLQHIEFLAQNNCDPCPQFVEQLIAAMGTTGSVIVYNKTFENCRLKELKADYPQFSNAITGIQDRLVDLMSPFRRKLCYLPAMQGSYSLKKVLPTLVPGLSYDDMPIANGGDASAAFYNLRFETDQQVISETRQALLDYCELDTLGMVKVLEKLGALIL